MRFSKYHGLGNDFILLEPDAPDDAALSSLLEPSRVRALCHRGFGIGADGVMAVSPALEASHDVVMRLVNSDGTTPEMCGNGIRCAVRHAVLVLGYRANPLAVLTPSGVRRCAWRALPDGSFEVSVSMGAPRFDPASVPLDLAHAAAGPGPEVRLELSATPSSPARTFTGVALSLGVPHLVMFGHASEAEALTWGPLLEHHPAFPARVNVGFCEVLGPSHLRNTVWERGCGLTWACGTGATSAAVAAARLGFVDPARPVTVTLRGGDLRITLHGPVEAPHEAEMTGPATRVFEGRLT
jgi:diaminopimelate epimerase